MSSGFPKRLFDLSHQLLDFELRVNQRAFGCELQIAIVIDVIAWILTAE